METKLLNLSGKEVGKFELPEFLFAVKPDPYFLHEAVKYYLANKHRGTASTKTRVDVSGGGRKPWKWSDLQHWNISPINGGYSVVGHNSE